MANPLFGRLPGAGNGNPGNNLNQLIQSFNSFRRQFSGDPRQQVQSLLNSGQMTQKDFNELQAMANQLLPYLK